MHPQIVAMLAAEHVRDMRAEVAVVRRARQARRARRGVAAIGRPRRLATA